MYNYTYTPVTVKVVKGSYSFAFNPQSRFPDHSAEFESTEEDCIGKALGALL